MKLAMTVMVRDEADIIAPMLDHHIRQGIDVFIVTDNGSVDGTTQILEEYAAKGIIELRHDPVHRKQQSVVVTQMARDAASVYGADWVLNADADEFWGPVNPELTLRDAFAHIDKGIQSFTVNVTDLIGEPALRGSGLQRLVYRDMRTTAELNQVGLHAHATHDAVHIGDPTIDVIQGNHFVSLESLGAPPTEYAIEVLHVPWRSWAQYSRKVENSGRAYLASDGLKPSPNHHGMRDFRRLQENTLFPSYLVRHPTAEDIVAGLASGSLVREDRLASSLPSPIADVPVDPAAAAHDRAIGAVIGGLEFRIKQLEGELARAADVRDALERNEAELGATLADAMAHTTELESMVTQLKNRRLVKTADRIANRLRRKP